MGSSRLYQGEQELTSLNSSSVDQEAMTVAQTELDSHANMCVFGKYCIVVLESKRTVDVGAFANAAGGLLKVLIVDALVAYIVSRPI